MSKCDICGNESKITIEGLKTPAHYCWDCHNRMLADLMDEDVPDVPKEIALYDNEMVSHSFKVEFMLFPHCKALKAYEAEDYGYRCEVFGTLDRNFLQMWDELMERLEKMMSLKYIAPNGQWNEDKVLGYIDYAENNSAPNIIIDGKPHAWDELGRTLSSYEGFQVKIEVVEATKDFE